MQKSKRPPCQKPGASSLGLLPIADRQKVCHWGQKSLIDRLFVCQCMQNAVRKVSGWQTKSLSINDFCIFCGFFYFFGATDRQKVCQQYKGPTIFFRFFWSLTDFLSVSACKNVPLTEKKSVNEAKSVPLTDKKSVSDQNYATDRQKVCQTMTFGPVTDFLSVSGTFLESLTDKKSVSNNKMIPLTDKKSVSEKFSKYIIQKTLFRRDKYKQCIAEMLLELNGTCS